MALPPQALQGLNNAADGLSVVLFAQALSGLSNAADHVPTSLPAALSVVNSLPPQALQGLNN
ncbi:MAG: hypothetical protein WCE32_02535, partial [Pseudolabrys sp.]